MAWAAHGGITKGDIHELLDGIVERGAPVMANRTLAWIRRMFSWAIERSLLEISPCAGIRAPTAETGRDRVLSDDELAAIWRASEALEKPHGAFVKLLILTGQRRGEIAGMRWSEIDFQSKLWTLPKERTKNAVQHTVPLSDSAVEILKSVPRIDGSDLVFTLNGRDQISAFDSTKKRIESSLPDMPPWTLHDIRRTFASGCARLGIDLHVVEKCLNHVSGSFAGIVGVYQRHDFGNEKRACLDAWSRFAEALVSGETGRNVIELSAARA